VISNHNYFKYVDLNLNLPNADTALNNKISAAEVCNQRTKKRCELKLINRKFAHRYYDTGREEPSFRLSGSRAATSMSMTSWADRFHVSVISWVLSISLAFSLTTRPHHTRTTTVFAAGYIFWRCCSGT